MKAILLYCRAGFEKECAAEIQQRAQSLDVSGFCRAKPNQAYVVFQPATEDGAEHLVDKLRLRDLVFARQMILALGLISNLPAGGRVESLLAALDSVSEPFFEVFVESADTEAGKDLLSFCRKFQKPLMAALGQAGRVDSDQGPHRLHVFFLNNATAYLGLSERERSSPWFMGIARMKISRAAPSRSARKLEEAFHVFLGEKAAQRRLCPGMRAVDLGAAPGGWSWQLIQRNLLVTAVDNAAMDPKLLAGGLVDHVRADGFRYRPVKKVDWLVCDMVEKPARIAKLVADWLARGWAHQCIFNLKLPMKKRLPELIRCGEIIARRLTEAGVEYRLAFKQLYHDREEVTGYLRRLTREPGKPARN